ncbi:hypothetical protein L3X38_036330 [Prunus dulcis]|uniref:No apical meristem-associated C-terminal domain-containing protein n=1 Tax=Prunus dulcis TaxID=3755 RepID=A0AAD4V1G9_PRUDU|nr:hypothetical protein L3X38_036330 [Prunus dulcis]
MVNNPPKSQRGVNWKPQEDEALCKGWVSISEDGAIGTNQSNDSFWLHVYQIFLENELGMSGARVRSPQAIASRFKIINQQCSLWKACMIKANARHVSGSNLEVNLEEDEDDVVMPTPRPLGRDKQNVEKKKGKGVEGYLNQSGKFFSKLVQQGNEAKEDRRRKLELLQEQHAYQIQQDKDANEKRIMSMDLSKFTPRKKKYWGNKEDEIIEA